VSGEDPAPDSRVGDQPPGWRQVVEGVGHDLAERVHVRRVRADRARPRPAPGRIVSAGHRAALRWWSRQRVSSPAGVSWPVTACAPSPIAAYTGGRDILSTSPQPSPIAATTA